MVSPKRNLLAILLTIFFITSCISANVAIAETKKSLAVSVPRQNYFEDACEAHGMRCFLNDHQDWNINVLVQNDPSNPFLEIADVYFLDPTAFDIQSLCWNNDDLVDLYSLLDKNTLENVMCLSHFTDLDDKLWGVPVFLGLYVVWVDEQALSQWVNLDTVENTIMELSTIVNLCLDSIKNKPDNTFLLGDIEIIMRQLELMATLTDVNTADFHRDGIVSYLNNLKDLYDNNLIHLTEVNDETTETSDVEYQYVFNITHGMLYDWYTEREKTLLYYPLLGTDVKQSVPLAARIGVIHISCDSKAIAAEFLANFIALDTQLELPTAGIVRRDAWDEICKRNVANDPWAIQMHNWWGNPITHKEYEAYLKSIERAQIGIGSFQFTTANSEIVRKYLLDSLTLEQTLDYLEKRFKEYITR